MMDRISATLGFDKIGRSPTEIVQDVFADAGETCIAVALAVGLLATALVLLLGNRFQGVAAPALAPTVTSPPAHGADPQRGASLANGRPVVHGTPARQDPYQALQGPTMHNSPCLASNSPLSRLACGASPQAPCHPSPLRVPVGASVLSRPPPASHEHLGPVQVGQFYMANVGQEQKVVKTTLVQTSTVMVKECTVNWSRHGVPSFRVTPQISEVPIACLLKGPFAIMAGRAPKDVAQLFEQEQRPVQTPQAAVRTRTTCVPEQRFKYMSAIGQMAGMGFQDTPELRQVLTMHGGNVDAALREFWHDA